MRMQSSFQWRCDVKGTQVKTPGLLEFLLNFVGVHIHANPFRFEFSEDRAFARAIWTGE